MANFRSHPTAATRWQQHFAGVSANNSISKCAVERQIVNLNNSPQIRHSENWNTLSVNVTLKQNLVYMEIILFLTVRFVICTMCFVSSGVVYSQQERGSLPDHLISKSQQEIDHIFYNVIPPKEKEFQNLRNTFSDMVSARRGNKFGPDEITLTQFILSTQKAINYAQNNRMLSKAKEIEDLRLSIQKSVNTHAGFKSQLDFLNRQLNEAKSKREEVRKKKAEDKRFAEMEGDFWSGSEAVADIGNPNGDFGDVISDSASKDFWEGGVKEDAAMSSSNNFFNSRTAGGSIDFWDGGIEPGSTDFSIEYKDGKEGVVNSYGDILIPFRDWKILSYQEGMASVEKNESNVKYNKCVFDGEDRWYYNVFESETGIVNRDGEYISSPQRKISGQVDLYKELTLTVTRGDCDAGCEARYARRKRERAAASKRCKQKMQNELQSLLSHYENQGYTR